MNGACGNCGGAGEPCCFNTVCTAANTACVDTGQGMRACLACGGAGQPCCNGGTCAMGGCCDHNVNTPTCLASGSMCSGNQGVCMNGGCMGGTCGELGQMCCGGDVGCTGGFTLCRNGTCQACGGLNQPCCDNPRGDPTICSPPFVCNFMNQQCRLP